MSLKSIFSFRRAGSDLKGLAENLQHDLPAGLVVFLIALPLCIGIAIASGVPPFAGIISAGIGGLLVSRFSGSHVTINGPAAGLIVVILTAGESLGNGNAAAGYPFLLAAIMIAGALLLIAGLLGAGKLGDFFPSSAVHGMLAAIGVIIMSKQIHVAMGIKPHGKDPLDLISEIPNSILHMNPEVAIVGLGSILILILFSMVKNKWVKLIPAPFVVVLFGIACSEGFDFFHAHSYLMFNSQPFQVGPELLVNLPSNLLGEVQFRADFSKVGTSVFWIAVVSIFLVQGIETLLSASAVDKLDPLKRKSELSKDLSAVGLGSTLSAMLGGLPMIAEIVRSSANINNGGRTSRANFFHGLFLVGFVFLVPWLIHEIPLAALAGILVFTGYRLTSPAVIRHTAEYGKDQLLIFFSTLVITLLTDLIVGMFAGILIKIIIHFSRGLKFSELFKSPHEVVSAGTEYKVVLKGNQVFSNYLSLKKVLSAAPAESRIHLDFSEVKMIDHTVTMNLDQFRRDWINAQGSWEESGKSHLVPVGHHPQSASLSIQGMPATSYQGNISHIEIPVSWKRFPLSQIGVPSHLKVIHDKQAGALNIVTGRMGFWIEDDNMGANEVFLPVISVVGSGFPVFSLSPEGVSDRILHALGEQDFDFSGQPEFSSAFVVKGNSKAELEQVFKPEAVKFLMNTDRNFLAFSDKMGMLVLSRTPMEADKDLLDFENKILGFLKNCGIASVQKNLNEKPTLKEKSRIRG